MSWSDPIVIIVGVGVALVAVVAVLAIISATPSLKEMFVGVTATPEIVGLVRGVLIYFVPIGAGAAIAYIQGWTDPRLLPLIPLAVGAIRQIESLVDKRLKPDQNAVNPPPVAGGGSKDLMGG